MQAYGDFLEAYQREVLAFLQQEKQREDPKEPLDLFFHGGMQTSVEHVLAPLYTQQLRLSNSLEPGSNELYHVLFDIRAAAEKEYRVWFKTHGFDYTHILPSPTHDSTPIQLPFYNDPDGREHKHAIQIGQLVITTEKTWEKTRAYQVSEPKDYRWLVYGNRWSAKASDASFKEVVWNAVMRLNALTDWSCYYSSPKKVQRAIHVQAMTIINEVSRTP